MSWEPINLVTVEQRPSVRPTLGSLRFIYPGRRHVFSGPPESLKTLVAEIETLEVIRAGGRVVLVDLETGPWDTRDLLRDLGATDDELAAVLYIEPDTPPTEETIAVLVALAPDLVVIDAAAGAYDLAGLDDNKRADVERFASLYVRGFWKAGIATILLDHVVKSTESRGRYAIGSERKLGGCDVHLGFETVKPLSRGSTGLIKITVHKDRFGHLPRPTVGMLRLESDPETNAISWTIDHDTSEADDEWRPTVLMEKVSRFLENYPGHGPVPRSTIEEANLGKSVKWIRIALDQLIAEGFVQETSGPRNARLNTHLQPFTSSSSSDLVPARPDEPTVTSSSSSTPYKGDEDEDKDAANQGQLVPSDTDTADTPHAREEPATP